MYILKKRSPHHVWRIESTAVKLFIIKQRPIKMVMITIRKNRFKIKYNRIPLTTYCVYCKIIIADTGKSLGGVLWSFLCYCMTNAHMITIPYCGLFSAHTLISQPLVVGPSPGDYFCVFISIISLSLFPSLHLFTYSFLFSVLSWISFPIAISIYIGLPLILSFSQYSPLPNNHSYGWPQ